MNYIPISANWNFYPSSGSISNNSFKLKDVKFVKRDLEPQNERAFQGVILISNTTCNIDCQYCYSKVHDKQIMSFRLARNFLMNLINSGEKNLIIHFFGGEPTLQTEFIKNIVTFFSGQKKLNVYFHINTNGIMSEEVLDYLIKNKFKIIVSSDGEPGFDGGYRGGAKYSLHVESTINQLAKSKALFRIRCTITKKNLYYLHNAIKYWYNLGVNFIHFEAINPYGMNLMGNDLIPDKSDYVKILKEVIEDAEDHKMWIISSPFTNLLSPTNTFCTTCAGDYLVLTPDGSITSCLRVQGKNDSFEKFILGHFNGKSESLTNSNIDHLRGISVAKSKKCGKCELMNICGGGCPMRNFLHTGSLLEPDPWECYVKKSLIKWGLRRFIEYINYNKFPSILGQHVFEKKAFSYPTFGDPVFKIERETQDYEKEMNFKKENNISFIYKTVGTSESEFTNLRRLSRCECF